MGTSNLKKLQAIALLGLAAFMALGFTIVQRGITEISKFGGSTLWSAGPQGKQTRSLPDFDRIQAGEVYEVDVSFGSVPSVVIEAPKDLLPHMTSVVSGGTLKLSTNTNYNLSNHARIRAHVVARRLNGASISGAGKMVINGKVSANEFDAHASGAATLKMSASVNTFRLEASGSSKTDITRLGAKTLQIEASGAADCTINGNIDSSSVEANGASNIRGKLSTGGADVVTSGASHAVLNVRDSLTGEASGASSISYSGRPSRVTKHTSGVANINQVG